MSWHLSRFHAGDLVEVRSKDEILATLDPHGCVEGLPFMPEMLQFCGKRFRVSAVAHKTCETARKTWKGRRLQTTVHLAGLRCDGSAHGGCQADCNLFWKDVWLKPARDDAPGSANVPADALPATSPICSEAKLFANTRLPSASEGDDALYSCQATKLYEATEPLAWWNPQQYVRDVWTGNHSLGRVLRVLWFAFLTWFLRRPPIAYRLLRSFRERMHRWLTGREVPDFQGVVGPGQPTPTGRLGLKPGERVRIKSKEEIVKTLDESGKNRGLAFDVELSPYCGRVAIVRSSVNRLLDELTGKMLDMKQPCIILEGVTCSGEYSSCRLLCPRAIPSYWREIWLERVNDHPRTQTDNEDGVTACQVSAPPVAGVTSPHDHRLALPILAAQETQVALVHEGGTV
jgi:hypothetical protein